MRPLYSQRYRKIRFLGFLLGVIIVFSGIISACSQETDDSLERVKQSGQFRVALSGDYPPFSFYSENGTLEGFDVDIAREIATQIGVTLEPVITEWSDKIPGLLGGKVDAILGCVAVHKDGSENIRFTAPYYHSTTRVLVRMGGGIEGMKDLVNKRVGAATGTTFELDARNMEKVQLRLFKAHNEAFHALQNGALDAIVTDRVVGDNAIKTGKFQVMFLNVTLDNRQVSFGLNKQDQALHSKMESILDEMRRDGTLQAFIRKVARCEYDCKIAFDKPPLE